MKRTYVFIGLLTCLVFHGNLFAQGARFVYQEEAVTNSTSVHDLLNLKKITEVETNIHGSKSKRPENKFAKIKTGEFQPRSYEAQSVLWEAPEIRHNPLYLEDIGLERYGQDAGLLQPVMSGVHFFGGVHNLPFHALIKRPFSCDYPLGHYRPGNCNPYLHYSLPW